MNHKQRTLFAYLTAALIVVLHSSAARADVRLPALIADGMVLQRNAEVPIYGNADDGEKVTVSFQGQDVSTVAKGGKWLVKLKDLKPGAAAMMSIAGKNKIELKNVLVGEVWLCSGQSNMGWTIEKSTNAAPTIADAKYPNIRLFTAPRLEADAPVADLKTAKKTEARWLETTPQTVASFSAVAYFFGRDLHKKLGVPIGLIHSSVGGTPAEAWMSEATLKSNPEFQSVHENYARAYERFTAAQATYEKEAAQAKSEGKPAPRTPSRAWKPTALYNGMIAPLVPYKIKGVIWYQGEANASRAGLYYTLFPALIRSWRATWGQGDFPFLFVQLAAVGESSPGLTDNSGARKGWQQLREAQLKTWQTVPHTAMAVSIDYGDLDVHPPQKQPIGERLALAARAVAYNEQIVYSGAIYDSMKIEKDKIVLQFKHQGGGLMTPNPGEELKGFIIAGSDRKFHLARAVIEGNKVIVSSPDVPNPVAVRYGWMHSPVVNLYNREGLPASPFRTDDW